MIATLDGTDAEIITHGEISIQLPTEDTVHTFHLSIQDGVLNQAGFVAGEIPCSAHSSCRARLFALEDSFSKTYQNPYPWAKESPYHEPWMFLNFSYGY